MVCEVYDNDNDNNRSPLLDLVIQVHKGALEYEPSGQNRIWYYTSKDRYHR